MKIIKERSRLIFLEYSQDDHQNIEKLVSTMDKIFTYVDDDKKAIYLPPGMENSIRKVFPRCSIEDRSQECWPAAKAAPEVKEHFEPRNDLQKDVIKFVLGHVKQEHPLVGLINSPGTGKALANSTKIPTLDGYKLMKNIQVGDKVFGFHGQQVNVIGVYPQGIRDIYKVTFDDGRVSYCDRDHLWNIYTSNMNQKTLPLWQIEKMYKYYSEARYMKSLEEDSNREPYIYRCRIPIVTHPVQYNRQEVPVDPYVVGAFMGDGCLTEYPLTISSGDPFIPTKIAKICGFMVRPSSDKNFNHVFYDISRGAKRVSTSEFFNKLPGLIGSNSYTKVIPDIYLYNSLEVRLELLRGLMDTDGSISYAEGRYHVSFSSCSKKLLEQVQWLVHSFGNSATIVTDSRIDKYREGFHGSVNFNIPNQIKDRLFTHPRKVYLSHQAVKTDHLRNRYSWLTIKDISFSHREEATCIKVDASDELFLTEDFIVTHNTFMASYCAVKVGLKTLIIAPTTRTRSQWASTLTGMLGIPPDNVTVATNSKEFINAKTDYVVTMQPTLQIINKTYDLERILKDKKFGIKIIDECQMWFQNIIRVDGCSNIQHNWYLTGTFGRSSDAENQIYHEMFGNIQLFTEKEKKPTFFNSKPGNIYGMKPHMYVDMYWMDSGINKEQADSMRRATRYGISIPKYTEMILPASGEVTTFVKKVIQIVKRSEKKTPYGTSLILVPTISSVEVMATHIRKAFPNMKVGTIHSKNGPANNDKAKEESDILISTVKSCGTGFDVPSLAKLIVLEQFKSWILATQVAGRLRRRPDGKETYMHDIVDKNIKQLRAWGNARSQVLKKISKKFTVIDY